ncbi:MAG TPA: hypothetical protein VIL18_14655 [Longimicrobiales bacterium]
MGPLLHLRRALLLLVLLAPLAAGPGGRVWRVDPQVGCPMDAEGVALRAPDAGVSCDPSQRTGLERGGDPRPAPYLASSLNALSVGIAEQAKSAGTAIGPIRYRSTAQPVAQSSRSSASRARCTRLERLDFANALDAACSGQRSVHSTTVPPPHTA